MASRMGRWKGSPARPRPATAAQPDVLNDATDAELRQLRADVHYLRGEVLAIGARQRAEQRSSLSDSIMATSLVVTHARLDPAPLVTVIMPTHNRCDVISEAVASIQAQTYRHWELIIATDRCTDTTADVVAKFADSDPRIRSVDVDFGGAGASRNAALDLATGSIVCYLDDDNIMHANWLASVAWAMATYPAADVAYGAMVIDHLDLVHAAGQPSGLPLLVHHDFDRAGLLRYNLSDASAVAHRWPIPHRWDAELTSYGDWDFFVKLTADRDPLKLPAIAVLYRTALPDRISLHHHGREDYERVAARVQTTAERTARTAP